MLNSVRKHFVLAAGVCLSLPLCLNCAFAAPDTVNAKPGVLTLSTPAAVAQPTTLPLVPAPPSVDAKSYLLMDANSGNIIAEKNADEPMPPASLTKIMTLYLAFHALQQGQMQLNSQIPISVAAWQMGGSKMFVKEGTEVSAEELLRGIIIDSGNDACVAMAEYLGGNEANFANLMNQEAQILSLTKTHFTDSTGMPHPDHYTTARDMATLARALIVQFPQYYPYFSEKSLTYSGIKQYNRNRLLWRANINADGIKTGHTEEAGYCLVGSAKQDDQRLIVVVMGTPSDNARTEATAALLTYGFRFFETHKLYEANAAISKTRVWKGKNKEITLGFAQPVYATIPRGQYAKLKATMDLNQTIKAPVSKGQPVGTLKVFLGDQQIGNYPVLALEDNPKGSLWRRMADSVRLSVHHLFGSKDKSNTAAEA
ncbi:MAG: dacA [Gammaproteobacteria bacterium]|jgi:D-alanyl-D-alanine carboxypeptidase (penicillin-binding protein 5/6)|nr:dacA [Gammaproteobacteria bacterium]